MEKKTFDLFRRIFLVLQPPPNLTISEWADKYRKLPQKDSSEHGRWHTDAAPYQREIMDAITDTRINRTVVMSAAQLGKTTAIILNPIGYYIHHDPAPIMVVQPTLAMAQSFSKERLAPMIHGARVLSQRIDSRSRYSGNTILQKHFPGGLISIVGANSPSSLASRAIRILFLDEVDRFPATAGTEGDPVSLAEKRTDTFWNKKIICVSTPTIEGMSRIAVEYKHSTQEEWNVPCPQCGDLQPLQWAAIKFDKNDLSKGVFHECQHCGVLSTEQEWKSSQKKGSFVAANPGHKVRGFHLNALASPWKPWTEIVEEFLKAKEEMEKGNIELLKSWTNTVLGETWKEKGEEIDSMTLLARRERYNCEVPSRVLVLTAAVDVQDNRLECEIVGWGVGKESYGIRYLKLHGSPGEEGTGSVWERLDKLLLSEFTRADGRKLRISCTCVDSGGHFTQNVYKFCKDKELRRVYAIKGYSGAARPYVGSVSKNNRMRVPLFPLGVDTGKELVLERLKVQFEKDDAGRIIGGYCHFPMEPEAGYDEAYFEGLTAEKRLVKYHKGRPRFEWRLKKSGARNEPFDLRVYNGAALEIFNPTLEADTERPPAKKAKKRGVVNKGI